MAIHRLKVRYENGEKSWWDYWEFAFPTAKEAADEGDKLIARSAPLQDLKEGQATISGYEVEEMEKKPHQGIPPFLQAMSGGKVNGG